MVNPILNIFRKKISEKFELHSKNIEICEEGFDQMGYILKTHINSIFGRSLNIRVIDSGSDNSTLIELVNLTTPHYDIERFGVSFVASPRHADVLVVTGPVANNMAIAVQKTYDATPSPKFVIAIGDDACNGGIFKNSYAVIGGADQIIPVDIKIPGNPPSPKKILLGLIELMETIRNQRPK
jgi:Ni,Fe-hydrogenase III small subunit